MITFAGSIKHITFAMFNTLSSNLHQCVQNDQPIIFIEVFFQYFIKITNYLLFT